MTQASDSTSKRSPRKRARASTGNEVLKKTFGKTEESVTPLSGSELPADEVVPGTPIRSATSRTDKVEPKQVPESTRNMVEAVSAKSSDGDALRQYQCTTNYYIPANKIRDWKYNDRSQEAVLSDPKFPELKDSIELAGRLAEAIVVRPLSSVDEDGFEFEQVIGCKRLTACKLISPNFPVECSVQALTDAEAAALQAAENKGRSDPPIWDRGCAWASLLDQKVYGSVRELALALGEKHEKTVANYVRFARYIQAEPEFRTLPLSRLAQAPLELLANIAKGKDVPVEERDELVQRIVEIEDDLRARPERATKLLEKAIVKFKAEKSNSGFDNRSVEKPRVFQSEYGKTLTLTRKNGELRMVLHADVASEVDHDELEGIVVSYLREKGLHMKEKAGK
ncbi:ParB N-terminal domain-containing protein [Marinobacter adhaerens]|uniref:ParB-like partition protein n=1 Tax=Marinobacter adhaerens (strain DSM 23420 / HP15) TaxID=225937 RepID=E4PSC8_MARAH|nr:ParB N-terminal domain-containing protein [Marinobacter adhaerens]ADQ00163.1 parB-like partition protein [Marinobacter adhaerens HP15]MBW4980623.1 ParB N-terminal domain-containing protein [Marinobacter adhaerens]